MNYQDVALRENLQSGIFVCDGGFDSGIIQMIRGGFEGGLLWLVIIVHALQHLNRISLWKACLKSSLDMV